MNTFHHLIMRNAHVRQSLPIQMTWQLRAHFTCFFRLQKLPTHSCKASMDLKTASANTAACYCKEWWRCFSDRCKAGCNSKPLVCTRPEAHHTVGVWETEWNYAARGCLSPSGREPSRSESPALETVSLARQIDSRGNLEDTVCLWLCKHAR